MNLRQTRKTLYVTLILLLVCAILLASASYAWFALATAPDVTGIHTNIGSNGSLEIALLSGDTYLDPSSIKSKIGSSLEVQDPLVSNLQWGNLLDLSDSGYGLDGVTLIPSRLQVSQSLIVGSGLLSIPDYNVDGRFAGFAANTATGVYSSDSSATFFTYDPANPGYGVRGVGSVAGVTAQQVALANARVAVRSYSNSAMNGIIRLWQEHGTDFFGILHEQYGGKTTQTGNADKLTVLSAMAQDLLVILDDLDSGMRQGIIGMTTAMISDEDEFIQVKTAFENKAIPLSVLIETLPITLPNEYSIRVDDLERDIRHMYYVIAQCSINADADTLLLYFLTAGNVFLNDYSLFIWESGGVGLGEDNVLTFLTASQLGPLHTVSRYVGEFSTFIEYEGVSVEINTIRGNDQVPAFELFSDTLEGIEQSQESGSLEAVRLDDIYGFAVDMAFRCNQTSDLLLQTMEDYRVEGGSELIDYQGGGSYMRFESEQMSNMQILLMMDALRVGFIDSHNNLLGVAKLNTSNYTETQTGVQVPLYLYEFTVTDSGGITMGERRSTESVITSLYRNEATVITAVVWLDGDYVDNSLAAIRDQTMVGVLNLQFSSSADLNPAYGDDSEETAPGTPTQPEETEPSEPADQSAYYLSFDGAGQYTIYTLDQGGDRDYEMQFAGALDEAAQTVTINHVTGYTDDNIIIPAVVADLDTSAYYAVSINPDRPFSELDYDAEGVDVSFVGVEGEKVGLSGTSMQFFLGDWLRRDYDIKLISFDGSGLDTSGVTDMSYIFYQCSSLTMLDVSGWDTSNVTDMSFMFYQCSGLTILDVSGFDTSNVITMKYMFAGCKNVQELDTISWDTSNVTNMSYMFNLCAALTKLDTSGLDTGKVTTLQGMFSSCTALKELNISGLDTSNVVNMMELFHMCFSLENLDVSLFDTSSAISMTNMFSYCESLTELDLSKWDTTEVTSARYMFYQCKNLTQLQMPQWDLSGIDAYEMFTGCPAGENLS